MRGKFRGKWNDWFYEIDNCNVLICWIGRYLDGWMPNLRTKGRKTNQSIARSRWRCSLECSRGVREDRHTRSIESSQEILIPIILPTAVHTSGVAQVSVVSSEKPASPLYFWTKSWGSRLCRLSKFSVIDSVVELSLFCHYFCLWFYEGHRNPVV